MKVTLPILNFLTLILTMAVSIASADVVTLRSGQTRTGQSVGGTATTVQLQTASGVFRATAPCRVGAIPLGHSND